MAFRYEDKVPTMEYKTLRYPGHAALMEDIRAMGLLDLTPVDVKGVKVVPRDAFIASVMPKLFKPKGRDLVALRVVVSGKKGGAAATKTFELVDRYDEAHDISAMMRTTGYSLSITGLMQARGQVTPPACTRRTNAFPPDVHRRAAQARRRDQRIVIDRRDYSRTNSAIVAPI